jgi:hypothetical protein
MYPLVVGTDAHGRSQWKGAIYEIAVFERAVTPGEVQGYKGSRVQGKKKGSGVQGYKGARQKSTRHPAADRPLIHYVFNQENTYETEFRGGKALGVRDLGKGEPADLVIPEQYTPYQRVYLGWDPDWMRNRSDWLDLVVNILGFVPFGILLFVQIGKWVLGIGELGREQKAYSLQPTATRQENPPVSPFMKGGGLEGGPFAKGGGLVVVVVVTVVVGFGVSLAIELLQAYLPSRDSSLRDLVTNTAGTLIGAVIATQLLRNRFALVTGDRWRRSGRKEKPQSAEAINSLYLKLNSLILFLNRAFEK